MSDPTPVDLGGSDPTPVELGGSDPTPVDVGAGLILGPPGRGVPTGGNPGQVLAKASDDDFDTEWVDPAGGGGAVDSVNGQTGAVVLGAGDVGAAPTVHGHAIGDVDGLQDELDGKQPAGDYLTEGDLPAPPDLSPYVKTVDLAEVATSGSYDDLGDKPDIPSSPGDVGARPAGDVPWEEVSGKPDEFPPDTHEHLMMEITDLGPALNNMMQSALDSVNGRIDSEVAGLQNELDGKQPVGDYLTEGDLPDLSGYVETSDPRLTDARTPTAHTHSIGDVTGLQGALGALDDAIGDVGSVLDSILEGTP